MENTTKKLAISRETYEAAGKIDGFVKIGESPGFQSYLGNGHEKTKGIKWIHENANHDELVILGYYLITCGDNVMVFDEGDGAVSIGVGVCPTNHYDAEDAFWAYVAAIKAALEGQAGIVAGETQIVRSVIGMITDGDEKNEATALSIVHSINIDPAQEEKIIENLAKNDIVARFVTPLEAANSNHCDPFSEMVSKALLEKPENPKWECPAFRERMAWLSIFAANVSAAATGLALQDSDRAFRLGQTQLEEFIGKMNMIVGGLLFNRDISLSNIDVAVKTASKEMNEIMIHQKYIPKENDPTP